MSDAAIRVLAGKGSRGFTHRAVDAQAGVPEGTTSRYARSREALFGLVADALFAGDRKATGGGHVKPTPPPATITSTPATVADALAAATQALLREPDRYLARVELQLEATRSSALRRHLKLSRAAFASDLARTLAALGIADAPAQADVLIAMIDGILHRQLVLGEAALPRPRLKALYRGCIAAMQVATQDPALARQSRMADPTQEST